MSTSRRALASDTQSNGSMSASKIAEKPKQYAVYIRPTIMKALKKRAIDEEISYSALTDRAIEFFLKQS